VVTSLPGYGFSDPPAGIHLSAFYLEPPPRPWPPVVREFIETQRRERAEDVAYSRMQATRPQTVAHGLTDSPAGLAAWIVDLSAPSATAAATSSPGSPASSCSPT
jgi:hypothetical protein